MCLPSLHISLGVFYKLFTDFEQDVHVLDELIALKTSLSSSGVQAGHGAFQKHIDTLREMNELYKEADKLGDDADFLDDLAIWGALDQENEDENLRKDARNLRIQAEHLVTKKQYLLLTTIIIIIQHYVIESASYGKENKQNIQQARGPL